MLATIRRPRALRRIAALRTILTKAEVRGPLEPPLSTLTLPEYFDSALLPFHASRPALICRSEAPRAHGGPLSSNLGVSSHLAWDFEEFDRYIQALARGLVCLGVQKGDRVGVIMGNSSAYAMIQWACARIGAILVTVNPAYRIDELITTLKLTSVSHLFVVPRIRTSSYLASLSAAISSLSSSSPHQIADPALPSLRSLLVVNNLPETEDFTKELTAVRAAVDFRDILVWDGPSLAPTSLQKDEVINIQFTSGTTGYPKGVCLTHSNLLNNALSIGDCMKLTPQDKLCNVPPLFHCFGLVLGNLAAWVYGSCIVYPSQIFNPVAIVDTLHDEKCTALHGVPTHFLGVLSEVQNRRRANIDVDLSSLRTGIAAGSPIPIELMRKLINEMNLRDLTIAYGMTETSPVSFQTRTTDTVVQRVETVGQASPHVQAKIIDPFSGSTSPVPVGVPGELCVAGYLLQKGYWNDIEQTQDVMKTHDDTTLWMHTGDQGVIDEEGYLRIVGRIKDIIIRGGENLYPVQIENVLVSHPKIREASAVSVPDEKFGEVVGAWVVRETTDTSAPELTREEVRMWVWNGMNPQNAPTWVWFVGEDCPETELPKTASGKVQKNILRDWSKTLASKGIGLVS